MPEAPGTINAPTAIRPIIIDRLHSPGGSGDLVWFTQAEIDGLIADAVSRLAMAAHLFVVYNEDQDTVAGQPNYQRIPGFIRPLGVFVSHRPLAQIARHEMDLMVDDLSAVCAAGELPAYVYHDGGLPTEFYVYKAPEQSNQNVAQAAEVMPDTTDIPIPRCLVPYITDFVLGELWGKDSDASQPELAAHFRGKRALYEQVIKELWGVAT